MTDRVYGFQDDHHQLIGMVHLGRMVKAQGVRDMEEVEQRAVKDALALAHAGFDSILLENFGDTPYFPEAAPPHIIAGMTRMGISVRRALVASDKSHIWVGVQVLRNDAKGALGIASAIGADFVRVNVHAGAMVTDQGIIEGRAYETCPYRDQCAPGCAILADVQVKHASSLGTRGLEEEAADLVYRAHADAVILTGGQTGGAIDVASLAQTRASLPEARLIAGSGLTLQNLGEILPHVNGLIVGTWVKEKGLVHNQVDPDRADTFVQAVRRWENSRHPWR